MNYSDDILENKEFKFFKQLMYNLALSICIMLLIVLVLVYCFKFGLYNVRSDSQAPYYYTGDMVVVVPQKKYKVGDIIKFDEDGTPVTHRLVYIFNDGTTDYYICHGDANGELNGDKADKDWENDYEYIKNYVELNNPTLAEIQGKFSGDVQFTTLNKIEGKVIGSVDNIGELFMFLKEHYLLFIALVTGIWCISYTIQVEIERRRSLRLL